MIGFKSLGNLYDIQTSSIGRLKKIIENLAWDKGSMVWWKSSTLHSSSDFVKEGVKSKQYFVAHTYV